MKGNIKIRSLIEDTYGNGFNSCDGFHFVHIADSNLGNPQRATHVHPTIYTPSFKIIPINFQMLSLFLFYTE